MPRAVKSARRRAPGERLHVLLNLDGRRFVHAAPRRVAVQPRGLALGDLDGDGDQDVAVAHHGSGHVALIINECTSCPADLDGSGDVGLADLLVVLSSWGACHGCPADLDGDGSVGLSDLLLTLSWWGPCR